MGSVAKVVDSELLPFYRVYKDGSMERLRGSPYVPPRLDDPITGVSSKDITISKNPLIQARLHLSPNCNNYYSNKLPVLVYCHGGGFCTESAFSHVEHQFLTSLTAEARCLAVSIEYRLAPEHPLPAEYEDCWYGLQWVASHNLAPQDRKPGFVPDPWVSDHADFARLFIGGDSSGANLAHNTLMRAATEELPGRVKILGAFITHPFFWGSKAVGSEKQETMGMSLPHTMWVTLYPSASDGIDNPLVNPFTEKAPSLATMPCKMLLVVVAKEDELLLSRGLLYYTAVKQSGWDGDVKLIEVEGEDHAFHILNYHSHNAKALIKRLADFLCN